MIENIMKKHHFEGDCLYSVDFRADLYTLVICAGHSEENKNIEREGVNEHDYTEDIGKKIYWQLVRNKQYNVVFLNRHNHNDYKNERLTVRDIINGTKGGLDLQLHLNDTVSRTAAGTLTCYYYGNEEGRQIAIDISAAINEALGLGFSYNYLGIVPHNAKGFPNLKNILDYTDNTSFLSEMFFLWNDDEFAKCTTPEGRDKMAGAIASALHVAMVRKIVS
jgi:N-acetylmuramoyl-L-alanine amidase